jgi:hypothetical protein
MKFPKTIYVRREQDGDTDYLLADEEVPDVDVDTAIGIYELQVPAKIVVTREVKRQELKR